MKITDLFVPFEDELQLLPSPRVPDPPLIEWKSAFGDLFFRVKGAEPEVLWCVLGRSAPLQRPLSSARLATLKKYVSPAFASCTFFRVVPFVVGDDWALVRPKRALVKSPSQPKGAIWQWKADFSGGQKQTDWLSQPLGWFEKWLDEQPARELNLAREFAPLDDAARVWAPYVGECERWKALVSALQKLAFAKPLDGLVPVWSLQNHGRTVVVVTNSMRNYPQPSPSTQTLLSLLMREIPLQLHQSRWRDIGIRGKETLRLPPKFIVDSPSQHQRLEAALLWRDFAREIGKTAEIEPLLRELMS